jgi:hypothetical protein
MFDTNYGYPQPNGVVALTLSPSKALTAHCHGGSYEGGVYAVPHPSPCESTYPCRSEAYPGRLPAPVASGARIVARFTVKFP